MLLINLDEIAGIALTKINERAMPARYLTAYLQSVKRISNSALLLI